MDDDGSDGHVDHTTISTLNPRQDLSLAQSPGLKAVPRGSTIRTGVARFREPWLSMLNKVSPTNTCNNRRSLPLQK